jgi:hypothetical protein
MDPAEVTKREPQSAIPTLKSIGVARDGVPEGLQVGSTLTIEHDGHKLSYCITNLSYVESVASGKATKLDLEVAKIYY